VLGATQNEYLDEDRLKQFIRQVKGKEKGIHIEAQSLFNQAYAGAKDYVQKMAKENNLEFKDLYSTLLVFFAVPLDRGRLFIASTQIGDGTLYALTPESVESTISPAQWLTLQQQQVGEDGNEVMPLTLSTREKWERYFDCRPDLKTTFVMGMTDGTADDLQPPPSTSETARYDSHFYVRRFYKEIQDKVLSQNNSATALLEYLDYEKKQSYDDRTVICLYSS